MTTTTANETSTETTTRDPKNEAVAQIVDSAFDLGRLWARHGLTLGRLALETSAASLGAPARLLGGLAEAFEPAAPEPQSDSAE